MLNILIVVLLLAWLLGFGFHIAAGGLIHVLLLLALIVLAIRLLTGRQVL